MNGYWSREILEQLKRMNENLDKLVRAQERAELLKERAATRSGNRYKEGYDW